MTTIIGVALLLAAAGAALLWLGRRQRRASGLPAGQVVYSDTGQWEELERPLRSRRYGLVGRPDYLVEVGKGRRMATVPVEVKSRTRPPAPYASHILQLATYCLLVEDVFGAPPPYGLIRYADATIRIPYTEGLKRQVLAAADAIRVARRLANVPRSHTEPGRCRSCGYRSACGPEVLT